MLLTPQLIAAAAKDIVEFWESSDLSSQDKVKILEMVKDYYISKGEYTHDQWLGALTGRVLNRNNPPTGIES